MKSIKYISFVILGSILSFACKEDRLLMYNDEEAGNDIYFYEKLNRRLTGNLMHFISLGLEPVDLKDSIIYIQVATTGNSSPQDRPIQVSISDTSSMVEGKHFKFLKPPVMRANKTLDTISIQLLRTADLTEKTVFLNLQLQANNHFNTKMAFKTNANVKQDLLNYALSFDDKLPVPYLWTTFASKAIIIAYFGEYSRRKVELMFEVLKPDTEIFYNPARPISIANIMNWSSYMKYWLAKEKNEGRMKVDENGKEITMGPSAR